MSTPCPMATACALALQGSLGDTLHLSRMQFAANISFHILFPSISIALAWVLVFMRWRWHRTARSAWLQAWQGWIRIFALTFALGVVSGVTMSFQFGTNWPGFMEKAGNIAGPLLGYEVLTAFFLEASFLGVLLYGQGRVSERVLTLCNVIVALGTTLSAFWILALNSWMHTPQGYRIEHGELVAADWWSVIFTPSLPFRLTHVLLASGLTVAFLLAGLSAWQIRTGHARAATAVSLRLGVSMAILLLPLQILAGDAHGLNTLAHQPAKIAAMEGIWKRESGVPLLLAAWPDEGQARNDWALGIPRGASLILTHDINGSIAGLQDFGDRHPPVLPVFWAFRVMVGTCAAMVAMAGLAAWQLHRRRWITNASETPWLWRGLSLMTFSGWVATVAGWIVTEVGRQPFLITGVLRTADAVTRTPAPMVAFSLAAYVTLYLGLLLAYVRALHHLASKPWPEHIAGSGDARLAAAANTVQHSPL